MTKRNTKLSSGIKNGRHRKSLDVENEKYTNYYIGFVFFLSRNFSTGTCDIESLRKRHLMKLTIVQLVHNMFLKFCCNTMLGRKNREIQEYRIQTTNLMGDIEKSQLKLLIIWKTTDALRIKKLKLIKFVVIKLFWVCFISNKKFCEKNEIHCIK